MTRRLVLRSPAKEEAPKSGAERLVAPVVRPGIASPDSTPRTGDRGADGIAISKDLSKYPNLIIQVKHSQRGVNLTESQVEDVLRAKDAYKVKRPVRMVVVTNAPDFTPAAHEVAKREGIVCLSRKNIDRAAILLRR